jgi:hypothetical protein
MSGISLLLVLRIGCHILCSKKTDTRLVLVSRHDTTIEYIQPESTVEPATHQSVQYVFTYAMQVDCIIPKPKTY